VCVCVCARYREIVYVGYVFTTTASFFGLEKKQQKKNEMYCTHTHIHMYKWTDVALNLHRVMDKSFQKKKRKESERENHILGGVVA
jgi:hypothetical protein